MSTYGTLRKRISAEMKRGDLTACCTAIGVAVEAAIQFYERRRFTWNEFNGEERTVDASTTMLTLSTSNYGANVLSLDSLKIRIGTRDYPLEKRTWAELDAIDSGQYYGYPEYYAIHANNIRFYPPNSAVSTAVMSGTYRLTSISACAGSACSNAWTNPAEGGNMIRAMAKSILFRDYLRAPNFAKQFYDVAEMEYREISRETREKQSSSRIKPTRW